MLKETGFKFFDHRIAKIDATHQVIAGTHPDEMELYYDIDARLNGVAKAKNKLAKPILLFLTIGPMEKYGLDFVDRSELPPPDNSIESYRPT